MNLTHDFRTDAAVARYSDSRDLWDTPLFESASFVALPTVGAFIEGWLLIVPRVHVLSYAQLPDNLWDEAEGFVAEVSQRLEAEYGPVAVFEHGPGTRQSPLGCGVDYAHFHIVPTRADLRTSANESFPTVTWKPYASISSVKEFRHSPHGYWALSQREYSRDWWVSSTTDQSPPNQLFRRILARSVGLHDSSFDWRNSSGEELISATVTRLACAIAHE